MKILGNRIYLELPPIPESKIELSSETQKQLEIDMLGKYDRMVVYAMGQSIINGPSFEPIIEIKPGDEVFADPNALRRGVIFKHEGKNLISISKSDVMHVF